MAANKERGELALEVNGRAYVLKLTTNAICEMETKLDRDLDSVMTGLQRGRMTDVRVLLWAMLQEHHADDIVDLKQVGTLIDEAGGIIEVSKKLQDVWKLNTAEAAKGTQRANGKRPRTARAGIGGNSTSTPAAPV